MFFIIGLSVISFILVILLIVILIKSKELKDYKKEIDKKEEHYKTLIEACNTITDNIEKEKQIYNQIVENVSAEEEKLKVVSSKFAVVESNLKLKYEEQSKLAKIAEENEQQIQVFQERYQKTIENIIENYEKQLEKLQEFYGEKEENYRAELEDLRDKRNKAILVAIQDYEENHKDNFNKLQLSESALNDIKVLKQIQPLLNNKEVLGKILYKVFYEKPYTDLAGRVLEGKSFSGIYKITNTLNQMCYVGQAVDIKKRWQQHIKRAVGAEPLVNNKLYPAMIESGVENFTFEVIDKCGKDKLNEREQYWQEFYAAKSFGYSIK